MKNNIVLGIVQNFAMLITLSILYDHFCAAYVGKRRLKANLLSGVLLGLIVILVILTPWDYVDGVFFDTRSVLLSVVGLFLGPIPTLLAVVLSALFRLYLGGVGALMGVCVITSSAAIGLLWSRLFPNWKTNRPMWHLLIMNLLVHTVMLLCINLLPQSLRASTFHTVFLPVIFLYPLATLFTGWYMLRQFTLRAANNALIDSEHRWKFALEGTGDGVWDWNLKTNEVFFSSQWKAMLGYQDNEIVNHLAEWEKRVHPEDLSYAYEAINAHIQGKTDLYVIEYRMYCKDGSVKWILDSGKVMEVDSNGIPSRFIGTHKDISHRKTRENQLAYERFLLESLMNFVPEPIYFKDKESHFLRVNQAAVSHYGCKSMVEVVGKTDFDFFDNKDARNRFETEQYIIETGEPYHQEESLIRKDGSQHWGITNKLPLRNPDGLIVGTFGITVDITRLKKTEIALKASEMYTKSILEAIPDLLFVVDDSFRFLEMKTGNPDDLYVPASVFLNKVVTEVFPSSLAKNFEETISSVLVNKRKEQIDYELYLEGETRFFDCNIIPFEDRRVLVMVRNITKRKKAEIELEHSQQVLKEYAAHLQNVREEERMLLSREIHDELGQMLIALKIDIGMFKQDITRTSSLDDQVMLTLKFEKVIDLLDTIIRTTRKIMTGLRPGMLELVGFNEAVQQHLREFEERFHLECSLIIDTEVPNFDEQRSIALFRILQEALNNVVKHAHASHIEVVLRQNDGQFLLQVGDNGIGLDPTASIRKDAYGLLGMRERVFLLGGKLMFLPNTGGGTLVRVEIPV